jgi:ferredoxin
MDYIRFIKREKWCNGMKTNPEIDNLTCISCGLCTKVCSKKILKINKKTVEVLDFENWGCRQCGLCMSVCPTKSIRVSGSDYEQFTEMPRNTITYDDLMNLLVNRRSVRNFTNKSVSDDIIEKVIKASTMAPIGAPPTNVNLLVIQGKEKLDSLYESVVTSWQRLIRSMKNPLFRLIFKRIAGANKYNSLITHALSAAKIYCEYANHNKNVFTFGAPAILLFHGEKIGVCISENCWLSCSYALTAAHALGLGTVFSGMIPPMINMNNSIKKQLGIPVNNDVFCCLMIGSPDPGIKFLRVIPRKLADVQYNC